MKEQIIKFVDKNVDGCGTDITVIAKVKGNILTEETINKVKDAIDEYQTSNGGEYDTEGCLDAAIEILEAAGFKLDFVNPDAVICF